MPLGPVGLRPELSQIDVKVHDTTVIALVLRMQAGVVGGRITKVSITASLRAFCDAVYGVVSQKSRS